MENQTKVIVRIIVSIVALIILAIINPLVIISPGERGVVMNMGAVSDKIMQEGPNFRTPFVQSVKKMNVKTQIEESEQSAASKDLQIVSSIVALNYNIKPDKVNLMWQEIEQPYQETIIEPAVKDVFKAGTAQYTAEELITKRAEVRDFIKLALTERLARSYIVVTDLSITDFDFSDSFNASIEAKVKAEQDALTAKNKLEQVKYEAEQRVAQSKGEAEAIKIQAQAITQQGGEDYVKLQWIKAWAEGGAQVPKFIIGDGGSNFLFNLGNE